MPDGPLVPGEFGTTGVKKIRKGKVLDPAELQRRIEALKKARSVKRTRSADIEAAILHDPLDNLHKMKRVEWEVIARFLADPRLSVTTLAKQMGYGSKEQVQKMLKKPHVQAMIGAIRAAQVAAMIRGDFGAQATLKAAQTKAAVKVVEMIDAREAGPKLNLQASTEVLDRTGLGKSSSVQHHHIHEILQHFTPEELDRYGRGGPPPERFKDVFAALEGPRLLPEE